MLREGGGKGKERDAYKLQFILFLRWSDFIKYWTLMGQPNLEGITYWV
jgi:hypothetical protein